jgi:hypothetical protein
MNTATGTVQPTVTPQLPPPLAAQVDALSLPQLCALTAVLDRVLATVQGRVPAPTAAELAAISARAQQEAAA